MIAVIAVALLLAGCGGSDDNEAAEEDRGIGIGDCFGEDGDRLVEYPCDAPQAEARVVRAANLVDATRPECPGDEFFVIEVITFVGGRQAGSGRSCAVPLSRLTDEHLDAIDDWLNPDHFGLPYVVPEDGGRPVPITNPPPEAGDCLAEVDLGGGDFVLVVAPCDSEDVVYEVIAVVALAEPCPEEARFAGDIGAVNVGEACLVPR